MNHVVLLVLRILAHIDWRSEIVRTWKEVRISMSKWEWVENLGCHLVLVDWWRQWITRHTRLELKKLGWRFPWRRKVGGRVRIDSTVLTILVVNQCWPKSTMSHFDTTIGFITLDIALFIKSFVCWYKKFIYWSYLEVGFWKEAFLSVNITAIFARWRT